MPKWYDDGVRIRTYISETGDYVSLGTRTEYPFAAGGNGIPTGWTQTVNPPAVATEVNWTTANGRFSISNASATISHASLYYGIYRDFPVTVGKNYILNIQARTMEGKWRVTRWVRYYWNGVTDAWGQRKNTEQDWEQLALFATPPAGTTFIRVYLWINYYMWPGEIENFEWGGQWQNFAMTQLDSTTPDPTWREVTCESHSLDIAYGRSKFTGRYDVATASLTVLNDTGQFIYQTVHPWGLRPGRFIKIDIYAPDGTQWPSYYGIIDSIADTFTLDGRAAAVINCLDTSTLLSNANVPTVSSDTTTYYSGGRFGALINAVGWHPTKRNISQGVYVQQGIYANGRSVRDELGLIADSEGGHFWSDRQGRLTYKDRNYYKNTPSCNTVQAELIAQCPDYIDEVMFKFPGVSGNAITTPYGPLLAFTNGVDIRTRLTFDDISGPQVTIVSQHNRWVFNKSAGANTLTFGFASPVTSQPLPFNDGEKIWLRCRYQLSTNTVFFYYGLDTGDLNGPANWVSLGSATLPGGWVTNSTGMIIGSRFDPMTFGFKGTIYRMTILDSLSLTTGVDINPRDIPGTMGQTSFRGTVDGNTYTVNQTGANVIIQADGNVTPYRLVIVDNVPNAVGQVVQELKALENDWNRDRVINDIQIANQGGSAFQFIDFASQKDYGPRTYQRLDFVNVNSVPDYNIERSHDLLDGFTQSILRVNRVTFNPDEITYKWALALWMGDLVRVRYLHPENGWNFAIVSHIQGFVHSLNMNGWQVALNLDQPQSFVFYDRPPADSTGWDVDYWDTGIWDNALVNGTYWNSGQTWSDSQTKWG